MSVIGYIFANIDGLSVLDDVLENIRLSAGKASRSFCSGELLIGSRPNPLDRGLYSVASQAVVPSDFSELDVLRFRFAQQEVLPLGAQPTFGLVRELRPHP